MKKSVVYDWFPNEATNLVKQTESQQKKPDFDLQPIRDTVFRAMDLEVDYLLRPLNSSIVL